MTRVVHVCRFGVVVIIVVIIIVIVRVADVFNEGALKLVRAQYA